MSKKLHSKLLSIVLVIAICCTTVFGSLLSVSATTYNGTYTVSVGDADHHIAYLSKYINAEVTFNLADGFSWGEFSVAKSSGGGTVSYAGLTATPVRATLVSGEKLDAQGLEALNVTANVLDPLDAANVNDILFETGVSGKYFSSLTFKLTLEVAASTAADGYITNNTEYSVNVSVAEDAIGLQYQTGTVVFTDASNGANKGHVKMLNWIANPQDSNVTTYKCDKCTDQLLQVYTNPYTDTDDHNWPSVTTNNGPWGHLRTSGVTVNYDDNGYLSLNVHGRYRYGNEHYVMVTDAQGNIIEKYSGSVTPTASSLKGTTLIADNNDLIKSFTISGLSAKDINTELYITLAVKYTVGSAGTYTTAQVHVSNTIAFKLADYCTAVVEGDKVVYPASATAEQIEADKDVAAALYYYGVSTNDYINKDKLDVNDSNEVETVEKTTDTWDGTLIEPTTFDTDDTTYLITRAEELAWIALKGDSATAGNTYKVADGIDTFYLTPNGAADYDNSSLETLKQTLSAVAATDSDGTHSWKCKAYVADVSGWASFQGTFDGNGVTICGLPAVESAGSTGLFPYVKGSVSIKNVTITDSYISGSRCAGAFVGAPFSHENNYLTSISFEKCAVVNCYIEQTITDTATGWSNVGGLAGSIGNAGSVTVDSCMVVDNEFGNASSATFKERAFFGNWVNYDTSTANVSLKNSFTDENPYANGWYPCNPANYSNIYTTCTVTADNQSSSFTDANVKVLTEAQMQGADALTTMNLNESVWFATSSYPELRVFHELRCVSNGESGHSEICVEVVVLADETQVPCTACSVAEVEHAFVSSGDGTQTCSACSYTAAIERIEKTVLKWNGEIAPGFSDDSTGEEGDPIIIYTPEELAFLVSGAGSTESESKTRHKYYKVAPNRIFNMNGFNNITLDSTIDDIDLANVNSGNNWTSETYQYNKTKVFQGQFDGNGLIVYNLYSSGDAAGLFPMANGDINASTEGDQSAPVKYPLSISNVTVVNSYFKSTNNGAGGILGAHQNYYRSDIILEQCAVQNCYFEADSTTNNTCVGALIGNINYEDKTTINNCFVADNEYVVTNSATDSKGGLIGRSSGYVDYQIKNTIVIGTTPYTTGANAHEYMSSKANCQNVYATENPLGVSGVTTLSAAKMSGAYAESNLVNLDFDEIWFATSGYPVLRKFHNIQFTSNGSNSHSDQCIDYINDAKCNVCGLEESAHNLTTDSITLISTCSDCGYSFKIPDCITDRLNGNELWSTKFATTDMFIDGYDADSNPTSSSTDCYMYGTSLNLKTSPYIGFTFAFRNEYMENKGDIKVRFTVNGNEIANTTGDLMINKQGAGRYHLYQLTAIPAKYLCKPVTVYLQYGENAEEAFGTYSAAGFAISAINAGEAYKYHASVAMAIVYYSEMLAARYGA